MKPTNSNVDDFCSSLSFHKGYRSEDVIARVLRQDNYYVVILADYQERRRQGAPGARNNDDFITLPDLDVALKGKRGYVEVKYKLNPDYTRKTQRYEHGIGLCKWNMYKKIQEETGTPVFLFIHEGKSGAVLFSHIDDLESVSRIYNGNKMDRGGMIFFPRASFDLWGKIAIVDNSIYHQKSFFDDDNNEGDKLFQLIRFGETTKA